MTHASIGARRRRFVLETPVDEPDGFGGQLRRYVAGPVVWGAIARAGSAERVRNGRGDAIGTHRLSLRWRPDVTSEMRVAVGSRRFAIRSAGDPDGRRRELVCEVEELAGEDDA